MGKISNKIVLFLICVFLCVSINGCAKKHDCDIDGHEFGEWIVDNEASCSVGGERHKQCKYCEEIISGVIEPLNHLNAQWIIKTEATCSNSGVLELVCNDCNEILETQIIEKKEHTFINDICTVCGYNKNICASGHIESKWIIDIDATCTSGLKHIECTRCGEILKTVKIPATTNHTYCDYECTVCHNRINTTGWSTGLDIRDGIVYGIGDCTDTELVIPTYMPNGTPVTEIADKAFYCNTSLISVYLPDTISIIGNYVFSSCKNLEEANLPKGITRTGASMFAYTKLKTIVIPDNVTTLSWSLFYCCYDLQEIVIPDSVQYIEKCAFSACNSLKSLIIPNSVIAIGDYAFEYCTSLEYFEIPTSIQKIGRWVFYEIPIDITYLGTQQQWESINKDSSWNYNFYGSILYEENN